MKKFIMMLSLLAMGGSAFVGVLNKNDIEIEQEALAVATKKVKQTSDDLNETEDKVKDAEAERKTVVDRRDEQSAKFNAAEQAVKSFESSIAADKAKLEKTELEQREIDLLISKIGVKNVDELQMTLKTLSDRQAELTGQITSGNAELEETKKSLVAAATSVNQLKSFQIERAKKVALNGLEATVIATNRQWGFVLVNAGKNLGVSADDSLLVKRSADRIGRLRIVSLEPDMVVAEVVDGSLPDGIRVQPGDKVIFENTK